MPSSPAVALAVDANVPHMRAWVAELTLARDGAETAIAEELRRFPESAWAHSVSARSEKGILKRAKRAIKRLGHKEVPEGERLGAGQGDRPRDWRGHGGVASAGSNRGPGP